LKEPTVRLPDVNVRKPVPTAELKIASFVTVGTEPRLQFPGDANAAVAVPVHVFAVF
jgi:hypothetical protein